MDCFFPALREKCRDFFCLFIGGLVYSSEHSCYSRPGGFEIRRKKRFDL